MKMKKLSGEITLTSMKRRHLPQVLRIESKVYPRPWSLGIFLSELALRESRHYHVALKNRTVMGYCGLMTVFEEGHITNVAVDPNHWGEGIATRLLLNSFDVARGLGIRDVTLEVRTQNKRALQLYMSFGFEPVGVRKGYYQDSGDDAIIMWAYGIDSKVSLERTHEIVRKLNLFGLAYRGDEGGEEIPGVSG